MKQTMWKAGHEDSLFLKKITEKLIKASTVKHGQRIKAGENTTGFSLLLPGYSTEDYSSYPAFWVRDPAWIAESGLIPAEEIWGWILLIGKTMSTDKPRNLASGGVILPYSLADHVNMDGSPVYYPGTYASDETQGPPWGKYPPHCDQYWLVFTAYIYAQIVGNWQSFGYRVSTPLGKLPLWEVCELTHNAFPVDPETQLCIAHEDIEEHIVDWGYNDSVVKTGKLLFPSLLRLESALKLSKLFERFGDMDRAMKYKRQAATIGKAIVSTFYEEKQGGEGWLMSATGIGHRPDVWGTAFAIYRGFVDDNIVKKLAQSLLRGFRERTTVIEGQVRHIPEPDFWEISRTNKGFYQNGAYWGYPSGWYIYALTLIDEGAGRDMFSEFITHLRTTYRENLKSCFWECINPKLGHYKDAGYLTTVALPYVSLLAKGMLQV